MRIWWRGGGLMAVAGVLAFAVAAAAVETCSLELKRLESSRGLLVDEEQIFRYVQPQHFFMQIHEGRNVSGDEGQQEFAKLVKKEPAEYNSKYPLKGVARLGTAKFCFVVDAAKKDAKSFDRLYFDLNHNGDLTDDKLIELNTSALGPGQPPRIDLKVPVDGQEIDYSFFLMAYGSFSDQFQYVSASLQAAAYRTGEITLGGEKHKLVLLDFNSNGRFDDVIAIPKDVTMGDGSIYAQPGDKLWVNPTPQEAYWRITAGNQQYVSKLVNVGGTFYELKITPAGDELTLTPSTLPTGQVTNGDGAFAAVVYNDDGVFLKLDGSKERPARLPAGEWKLLEYGIDLTEQLAKAEKAAKAAGQEKSPGLLGAFGKMLFGATAAPTGRTAVSARGTAAYKPVKVRAGETTEMPFGPPYRPIVKAGFVQEGTAFLSLEIVGSTGEVCDDLTVNGGRPKAPKFTIATKDGKEVASGSFEYG